MIGLLKKIFRRTEKIYTEAQVRKIIYATMEDCAAICDSNALQARRDYDLFKQISSHPDTDMGVLKFACYEGQAYRDATDIRELKNVKKG